MRDYIVVWNPTTFVIVAVLKRASFSPKYPGLYQGKMSMCKDDEDAQRRAAAYVAQMKLLSPR